MGLHQEDVSPEVKLKQAVQVVRPTEELQLSYSFSVAKTTDVTLNLSMLSDVLYESEYESQLWMLYDSNKQLVTSGDAYPSKWCVKLEKGEYTCRAHVRHEKRETLEKLQETCLLVSSKLVNTVSLDVYSSFCQASVCGKKSNTLSSSPGKPAVVYIAPLSTDKHSKGATLGQYLTGTATFPKDELGKKCDIYNFKYILPEAPKKKDKSKERESKKNKTEDAVAFKEALREVKTTWITKLPPQSKDGKELYSELCDDGGSTAPVHAARLAALDKDERDWKEISATADKLLASIDQNEVLAWQGTKTDTRENAGEVKKDMEKQRGQLLEGLAAKGTAIIEGNLDSQEDLPQIYSTIVKFAEISDSKVVNFMVKHAIHLGHYARGLKLVLKQQEEKNSKELEKKAIELMGNLGWDHVVSLLEKAQPAHYPADYQPF